MIWLKGCPKCSGDMHFDPLVEEYVCLQCGLSVDRLPPGQGEPPLRPLRLTGAVAPSPAGLPDRPAEQAARTGSDTPGSSPEGR